jgi:hypothetical protein
MRPYYKTFLALSTSLPGYFWLISHRKMPKLCHKEFYNIGHRSEDGSSVDAAKAWELRLRQLLMDRIETKVPPSLYR